MGNENPHNAQRLLWAGFMAILAAGVGFSIRAGILGDWGDQFGFTKSDLGAITGGGLTGFGIIILIGSFLADKLGYGRLMIAAFICHLLSAVLTLAATPVYDAIASGGPESADTAKSAAFFCLYWGMFLFAIGNGIAEAVVNPLVATLFPENKTHYLNILHAGWPGGLIAGGLASYFMAGKVRWEIQIALFLIPTVLYGLMMIGQRFPRSEAGQKGVKYRDMLGELGVLGATVICALLVVFFSSDLLPLLFSLTGADSAPSDSTRWIIALVMGLVLLGSFGAAIGFRLGPPLLAFLLIVHAMVGYVELGTDSWISTITGNIMDNKTYGLLLFVYTSSLMFLLRFFAGPIVHQISPLGLLLVSAILGAVGLFMLGSAEGVIICVAAATVYGIGKTYFWPTMLGVVSERFPKGGAITIGSLGGVGMLSAGLLGGPAIGYKQDYFAAQELQQKAPEVAKEYIAQDEARGFLFLPKIEGIDGDKLGDIKEKEEAIKAAESKAANGDQEPAAVDAKDKDISPDAGEGQGGDEASSAADTTAVPQLTEAEKQVIAADLVGGRMALKLTALVPSLMALCYLGLILYFRARGGYKQVSLDSEEQ